MLRAILARALSFRSRIASDTSPHSLARIRIMYLLTHARSHTNSFFCTARTRTCICYHAHKLTHLRTCGHHTCNAHVRISPAKTRCSPTRMHAHAHNAHASNSSQAPKTVLHRINNNTLALKAIADAGVMNAGCSAEGACVLVLKKASL